MKITTKPAPATFALVATLLTLQSGWAFYNPQTGRWLNRDPIGDQGGPNLFAAAGNRTVSLIDPQGLIQWAPATYVDEQKIGPWPGASPPYDKELAVKRYTVKTDDQLSSITVWRSIGGEYWCHGYTFDGSSAGGGPYSPYSDQVPAILTGDGWKPICCVNAKAGEDIVVFYNRHGVSHSGKISKIELRKYTIGKLERFAFDELKSMITSKQDVPPPGPTTESFRNNAGRWGKYTCYTKQNPSGPCCDHGDDERELK